VVLVAAALVAAVGFLYAGVAGHELVTFDDPGYVGENPWVRGGWTWQGLRWAWTSFEMFNWHPLTWMSHQLDCELWGLDAGAHLLTNVALHAASAVLLLVFLHGATGRLWTSALVAALFALHPLRVESVAWVSERKDVLSTTLWMATLVAYGVYARRPSPGRHLVVVLAFALGLAAKPMLVTLPFVLLLLDVWPLRRWTGRSPAASVAADRSVPSSRGSTPKSRRAGSR